MSKRSKILLAAVLVVVATSMLLMFDVPPPPDDAQARIDRPPGYPYFGTMLWRKGTDGDPEALDHSSRFWRLTVKIGSNAADSVEVKIKDVGSGSWVTLTYPGEVIIAQSWSMFFYGPEIDSVEVFTGTAAYCRLDYWYD